MFAEERVAEYLTETEIEAELVKGLEGMGLEGERVLALIPDRTRTMPLPLFFRLLTRHLLDKVKALDFLVALGTHPPLDEPDLLNLVGISAEEKSGAYREVGLFNHRWNDDKALVTLDTIPADEVAQLSEGRLQEEVLIRVNRMALDYDHLLICGPVFPHEVVGFSGGNKYFFPGISGSEVIDFTHWLGALITSHQTIGRKDTPMRRVIDRAAAAIPRSRHALCSVVGHHATQSMVTHQGVYGVFSGSPEEAFSAAADLSARVHVRRVEQPYQRVLSMLPEMYSELWTGAKGMYKLEPVVADGGEVILYAPHIKEFSAVHGEVIKAVGYHVRDYFVKQWDRFSHYPRGVLAHATHLRGTGTYEDGVERPRIQVTLATKIPEQDCRQVNLGYLDPETIDPAEWTGQEAEGILVVPGAGEYLYLLK